MPDSQRRDEWGTLLDAHGDALWGLIRKLCRHQQDAEDVFQDAAARAWRHWPGLAALGNPRAWLLTIGYRAFLDERKRRPAGEPLGEAEAFVPDRRFAGPTAAAVASEEACRVRDAVGALGDDVREVFVLHYTGGLSIAEAAEAMGINAGTAKSRLARGLNELRRRFA